MITSMNEHYFEWQERALKAEARVEFLEDFIDHIGLDFEPDGCYGIDYLFFDYELPSGKILEGRTGKELLEKVEKHEVH
jgi:hypothetical protein